MAATAMTKKKLSVPAQHVYKVLNEVADSEGNVMISKEELKKLAGYKCKRSVRNGIIELEKCGIIRIEPKNRNGFSLANNYKLVAAI